MNDLAFLGGRAVYAGVVAVLAAGNLADLSGSVAYAEASGVPAAGVAVPAGSLLLLAGAVSVALGVYPLAGVAAVVAFLMAVTPAMHDFWTMEGERRDAEFAQFLKNVGLLGAALLLVGVGGAAWPYALGGSLA